MQADIVNIDSIELQEGVLIPRSASLKIKRSQSIVSQAQKEAKKIVKEAVRNSEQISTEAYQAGFERGLVTSIDAVCQFIANNHDYIQDFYLKSQEHISKVLNEILGEEVVIQSILNRWLDEVTDKKASSTLCILLPYAKREIKKSLLSQLDKKYSDNVIFKYHDQPSFIFKFKDRVAEFYPESFVSAAVGEAVNRRTIIKDNQDVSKQTLRLLYATITKYYNGLEGSNEESINDHLVEVDDDDNQYHDE